MVYQMSSTRGLQLIAVELVANPSIIFMVEPTTGLDTRAAAIIAMRLVKNVAGTGRTIEAFDEVKKKNC